MTDGKASGHGSSAVTGLLNSPGANKLVEELGAYAEARLQHMLTGMGTKVGDAATRLGSAHVSPGNLVGVLGKGGKLIGGQVASHAKEAVKDKIKGAIGLKHGPSHGGGAKSITVIEDIDVGVPVREAYNQWTQFTEFSRFTKGVVNVEQKDETTSQWEVKIAKSSRAWTGTVMEQVPDERIAWTSEGAKGTTRGVVTFHPAGENLTKVLLVLEYYPKGLFEKTANIWRAQGRRARLDLKLYRKFVMMRGEATGAWRGEIRDGKVVRGPDEEPEEKDREAGGDEGEEKDEEARGEQKDREARDEPDEDEDEERDDEEQPEDRYDERDEDGARAASGTGPESEDDEDEEDEEDDDEEDDEDDEDRDDEEAAAGSRRRPR
ncbi:SRPBCC family protein [Streptomyces cinereospinus]|uniref:SRPBCC family protein n=1 Tax=Streptomyces cinereospinus TaxID=285561 RepID=A0ABV5N6B2_9ACTN